METYSVLTDLMLLKCPFYPRNLQIQVESMNSSVISTEKRENNLKFVWNHKDSSSQSNLEKKNKAGHILPDFKIYCRATVIRTVW